MKGIVRLFISHMATFFGINGKGLGQSPAVPRGAGGHTERGEPLRHALRRASFPGLARVVLLQAGEPLSFAAPESSATPVSHTIFFAVLVICTLLRLLVVAAMPVLGAEAYYWEWSKQLAWGYVDHPPMVAFLIYLLTSLGRDSTFFIKLPALVLSMLTTGIFYLLARSMFGARTAVSASSILQVLPFFAAVSVITIPDTPLAFFWVLTVYCVYRATILNQRLYWYAAGISLGLALLSKYHAFLLIPCVLLYLILSPDLKVWLRKKEPYAGAMIALFIFSPNLLWNINRGLATFEFLLVERQGSIGLSPAGSAEFIGGFMALLSPLFAALVVRLLPQLYRRARKGLDNRYLLLLSTSLPVMVFFGLLSPLIHVGMHWPGVAYFTLLLAVVAALIHPLGPAGPTIRQRFAQMSISLSAALVLLGYLIIPAVPILPAAVRLGNYTVPLASHRVYAELHGWQELGKGVRGLIHDMPDPQHTFILTNSYRLASRIRLFADPTLITRTTGSKAPHQYKIWNERYNLSGWDAIFIDEKKNDTYLRVIQELFERVGSFEPLELTKNNQRLRTFYMVRCFKSKK